MYIEIDNKNNALLTKQVFIHCRRQSYVYYIAILSGDTPKNYTQHL